MVSQELLKTPRTRAAPRLGGSWNRGQDATCELFVGALLQCTIAPAEHHRVPGPTSGNALYVYYWQLRELLQEVER